jgi:6-phosphogluconolactonase
MVSEAMFSRVQVPETNIHRVPTENPDAAEAASEYEKWLREFFATGPGEVPRFDLMLLGLGSDGHTASLFPGTKALLERSRLFVANWVEQLQTQRLTMTLPVINNAREVMFLVAGREKAEALRRILAVQSEGTEARLPAQLVQPVSGRLLWLVDADAAGCS